VTIARRLSASVRSVGLRYAEPCGHTFREHVTLCVHDAVELGIVHTSKAKTYLLKNMNDHSVTVSARYSNDHYIFKSVSKYRPSVILTTACVLASRASADPTIGLCSVIPDHFSKVWIHVWRGRPACRFQLQFVYSAYAWMSLNAVSVIRATKCAISILLFHIHWARNALLICVCGGEAKNLPACQICWLVLHIFAVLQ